MVEGGEGRIGVYRSCELYGGGSGGLVDVLSFF